MRNFIEFNWNARIRILIEEGTWAFFLLMVVRSRKLDLRQK